MNDIGIVIILILTIFFFVSAVLGFTRYPKAEKHPKKPRNGKK